MGLIDYMFMAILVIASSFVGAYAGVIHLFSKWDEEEEMYDDDLL